MKLDSASEQGQPLLQQGQPLLAVEAKTDCSWSSVTLVQGQPLPMLQGQPLQLQGQPLQAHLDLAPSLGQAHHR